jgi:hypothetical protein
LLIAGVAAPAAHASAITDSLLRDRLIGSWADAGDCKKNGALTFNADGTFSLTGPDTPDEKGTFDVKDGKLAGKSDRRDMPTIDILFDDKTLVLGPDRLDRCPAPP